jgi:ATP-dependent DNA helicase RecQ
VVEKIKPRPIVTAFTATATPAVKNDISTQLKMKEPKIY